jgi:hypothetical protein
MHKEFFLTCNTLLHVSTLLSHLREELFVVVTLRLHFIVELLTVYYVAYGGANNKKFSLKMIQQGRNM